MKNTVIIAIIFVLLALWFLTRPKAVYGGGRPTDQFVSLCPPGYKITGSGCVTTEETIGMGPRP
jgi:hypothetical protein